jgi:hypothetical protein
MGLLRAAADAVIVGAGTLRASPQILWIAEQTYRPLADVYRSFRAALGKPQPPLNVIVTARVESRPSGHLQPSKLMQWKTMAY